MTATRALKPEGRAITGWHVLAALMAFFGVIFAMNGALIYYALTSFPGLEVASSYKAGQEFRADVAAAREQDHRGWTVTEAVAMTDGGVRIAAEFHDRDGDALVGLDVTATIAHIATTKQDTTVTLLPTGLGTYEAVAEGVAPGRWTLILDASRGGERQFLSRNTVMLTP